MIVFLENTGKHVILPQQETKMSHVNTISWTPTDGPHRPVHTWPGAFLIVAFPCPHLPRANNLFQKVLMTLKLQTCTTPSNLEDDIFFMHISILGIKTHVIHQQEPKRQDSDLLLWKKANSAHNFNYLGQTTDFHYCKWDLCIHSAEHGTENLLLILTPEVLLPHKALKE